MPNEPSKDTSNQTFYRLSGARHKIPNIRVQVWPTFKGYNTAFEKAVSAAHAAMTEGELRKIDKDAGKITIKHGPLTKLDMPRTIAFRVKDERGHEFYQY